ncbi:MAG: protein kinase [Prevotella sp.]
MNYDELLSARVIEKGTFSHLVIGKFVKRNVDGKYINIIELDDRLADSIFFEEGLKQELLNVGKIKSSHQLKFMRPTEELKDVLGKAIIIERGSFITLEQLLYDTPSLLARKEFVDNLTRQAFEAAKTLNELQIYHICFAPKNMMIRRGDNQLMLLSHGSYYLKITDQESLYGDMVDFVAPEVLSHGSVDARSDVYSLGKLLEYLYSMGEMPGEVKRVVRKATRELPEDRYDCVEDMEKALNRLRHFSNSLITLVVASLVALAIVGAFFTIVPEQDDMEYVKPAPKEVEEDLLDDGFDPITELGFIASDTTGILTEEQKKKYEEYEKKAESIFRKRFEREAERVISKVYTKSNMGVGEAKFMAESQKALEELSKVQEEIASQTALSGAKSQRIASEIIEKVTNSKKSLLNKD